MHTTNTFTDNCQVSTVSTTVVAIIPCQLTRLTSSNLIARKDIATFTVIHKWAINKLN